MPDAAHAGAEGLDLVEHVVRRAGEHRVGVHELLHRRGAMIDRIAVPIRDEAMRARPAFMIATLAAIEL